MFVFYVLWCVCFLCVFLCLFVVCIVFVVFIIMFSFYIFLGFLFIFFMFVLLLFLCFVFRLSHILIREDLLHQAVDRIAAWRSPLIPSRSPSPSLPLVPLSREEFERIQAELRAPHRSPAGPSRAISAPGGPRAFDLPPSVPAKSSFFRSSFRWRSTFGDPVRLHNKSIRTSYSPPGIVVRPPPPSGIPGGGGGFPPPPRRGRRCFPRRWGMRSSIGRPRGRSLSLAVSSEWRLSAVAAGGGKRCGVQGSVVSPGDIPVKFPPCDVRRGYGSGALFAAQVSHGRRTTVSRRIPCSAGGRATGVIGAPPMAGVGGTPCGLPPRGSFIGGGPGPSGGVFPPGQPMPPRPYIPIEQNIPGAPGGGRLIGVRLAAPPRLPPHQRLPAPPSVGPTRPPPRRDLVVPTTVCSPSRMGRENPSENAAVSAAAAGAAASRAAGAVAVGHRAASRWSGCWAG